MTIDDVEAAYLFGRPAGERRNRGVTFTPQWIVDLMIGFVAQRRRSDVTVVDTGAGAGRFSISAARALPETRVIAIESDSELASVLRKLIRRLKLAGRVSVLHEDFLSVSIPDDRPRIFIGNPPYVRHHALPRSRKSWLGMAGRALGNTFSELAGLHVYFLLRCLMEAKSGDRLVMVLPSEWLETRYGADLKRSLLDRASSIALYVFPPGAQIFEGTMTTSVVLDLGFGGAGVDVSAGLIDPSKKSIVRRPLTMQLPQTAPERANWLHLAWAATGCEHAFDRDLPGTVELGDLFRIHRGQVTGMNSVWIANRDTEPLIPDRFLFPSVTDAKEILGSNSGGLDSQVALRRVIDLPADLTGLEECERVRVMRFLDLAKKSGAADTYIAKHRSPWWRVGLREPPAIVMSYMARRAPKFAINRCSARLLNIAHGLYPKVRLSDAQLRAIVGWLDESPPSRVGRTYAGGLIKVEPGDASRIRVPDPFAIAPRLAA